MYLWGSTDLQHLMIVPDRKEILKACSLLSMMQNNVEGINLTFR